MQTRNWPFGIALLIFLLSLLGGLGIEKGFLFPYFFNRPIQHWLRTEAPLSMRHVSLGNVQGGLISGIRLQNGQLEYSTKAYDLSLQLASLQTHLTWLDLLLLRTSWHTPDPFMEWNQPRLTLHLKKEGKQGDDLPDTKNLILGLLPLCNQNPGQVLSPLREIRITKGSLEMKRNNHAPLLLRNVDIDYRHQEASPLPAIHERLNAWSRRKALPPVSPPLAETLDFSGLTEHDTPIAFTLQRHLTTGEHRFTLHQPWPDHPLHLQFLPDKGLTRVYLNAGNKISCEGILHLEDDLRGHMTGSMVKGSFSYEDIHVTDLPFPLKRLPRLVAAAIRGWHDAPFLIQASAEHFFIQTHFQIDDLTVRVQLKRLDPDRLWFMLAVGEKGNWSGTYHLKEKRYQSVIRIHALDAHDFFILFREPKEIEMEGTFQGEIQLFGPRKNVSLEGALVAGKGHFRGAPFNQAYISGGGTGRYFYFDENAKLEQKEGVIQISGNIDFGNRTNIFQNVKFVPLGALQTEKMTFKNEEEESPEIDFPLIPDLLDVGIKGSEGETADDAAVEVKIEKSINF